MEDWYKSDSVTSFYHFPLLHCILMRSANISFGVRLEGFFRIFFLDTDSNLRVIFFLLPDCYIGFHRGGS